MSITPEKQRMVRLRLTLLKDFLLAKMYFIVESLDKVDENRTCIVQSCYYTDR